MAVMSIGRAVSHFADADPHQPAVTGWEPDGSQRTVTRRQFDRTTNRLARGYAELGVRQGDLVTIALPNSIEFYEAAVATWKLGAIPQPVSYRLPDRERQAIVELADSRLVIGADPAAHSGRTVIPQGWQPDPSLDDGALPDAIAPSFKAPTSGGSTGRPKLILAGNPGVVDPDAENRLGVRPNGCHVVPGPLYHNAPFTYSCSGLAVGNHIVVLPKFDAEATLRAVAEHRATFMLLVPTMMLRIWRLPEEQRNAFDLSSLEVIWHMAAPCPPWLKENWINWVGGERLFELYAGTEAQAVTIVRGDEWMAHRGTVGRCLIGEMKVVDSDTGLDVPAGTIGEIYMRTSAAGSPTYRYLGAEPRTLPGNWESLGDMGMIDAEGYVYLSDRRADMILSGGANIYPAEVENALMEHPTVASAAVIGLPDDDLGSRLHALVQVTGDIDEGELRAFLAERLVRYKIPRSFEFTTDQVRDDAGKVRRSALRDERT